MRRLLHALWLTSCVALVACSDSPAPNDAGPGADGPLDGTRPECALDPDCTDRVSCTTDRCFAGRCVYEPEASRCPSGSVCDLSRGCLPRRPCTTAAQCVDADPCSRDERCSESGYCVFEALPNDTPCGAGLACRGGACSCPAANPLRCGDQCFNPQTDSAHCGTCETSCGAGAFCADGRCACSAPQTWCPRLGCTDTSVDQENCGACGNRCPSPARCTDGQCLLPCAMGTHRCGTSCLPDNSPMSCGLRCDPCPAPRNGRAACMGSGVVSDCGVVCDAGYHACGTRCVSDNDASSCGLRCTPCPTPSNGTVACVMAACRLTCNAGFHACGDNCAANDAVASCGDRCAPCPTPENGVAACVAGRCDFTCRDGFRRCGDVCSDGTSPLGCGPSCTRCRVPVNGRATCTAGACGFQCIPGFHACGEECRADISPDSCGARCEPCTAPENAAPTCEMGTCSFECNPGYVRVGDGCREQPRLRAPLSGSFVTGRRPTFRWSTPPDAPMDSAAEVCRDRACTEVIATFPAGPGPGTARPTADLPRGTLFWRVRAGEASSPVWRVGVTGPADRPEAPVATWGHDPDFDGDGFADVVAGAPLLGMPGPRVYVYRGTAGGTTPMGRVTVPDPMPASPMATSGTQFGWSLAAGDYTGDGYSDLAVGAPAIGNNVGRVYLFRGGPAGLATIPTAALEGLDGEGAYFGYAVAAVGDVNADGYADLAVGAYGARNGRVFVYHGNGRGLAATPSVTLEGPAMAGTRFGQAVAGLGDVDADGDDDLIVGAPEHSGGVGRAFVYLGSRFGLAVDASAALVDPFGGRAGTSVAGVGDTNGDGYPDGAMGAPSVDNGTGRIHVYHGGAMGLANPASRTVIGPAGMEADFGTSLVGAGDTNGDGFADVLVSAPRVDTYTGRAYVFRGAEAGVALTPAQNLFDLAAGSRALFGGALGGARDIDNDGYADVVVSAERASMFVGQITMYRGGSEGLGRPTVFTGPEGSGTRLGISVAERPPVCRADLDA